METEKKINLLKELLVRIEKRRRIPGGTRGSATKIESTISTNGIKEEIPYFPEEFELERNDEFPEIQEEAFPQIEEETHMEQIEEGEITDRVEPIPQIFHPEQKGTDQKTTPEKEEITLPWFIESSIQKPPAEKEEVLKKEEKIAVEQISRDIPIEKFTEEKKEIPATPPFSQAKPIQITGSREPIPELTIGILLEKAYKVGE